VADPLHIALTKLAINAHAVESSVSIPLNRAVGSTSAAVSHWKANLPAKPRPARTRRQPWRQQIPLRLHQQRPLHPNPRPVHDVLDNCMECTTPVNYARHWNVEVYIASFNLFPSAERFVYILLCCLAFIFRLMLLLVPSSVSPHARRYFFLILFMIPCFACELPVFALCRFLVSLVNYQDLLVG